MTKSLPKYLYHLFCLMTKVGARFRPNLEKKSLYMDLDLINLFLEKLNKGENIDLTHKDAKRFFMSINEACNLVIAASQIEGKFKTFILESLE